MRTTVAVFAAIAAVALPSVAKAGDVAMRTIDVPAGPRAIASARTGMRFDMLGFRWSGAGSVRYRTHRLHGGWSPWRAAGDDVAWTGTADAFQAKRSGDVRRLHAYELWSRVTTSQPRTVSTAGSPPIVSRAGWDANEEIVRARPIIARSLKVAIVHHTAGTNSYTRAQAAAIVRGIEVYHVKANGWNDIGYNFLVDRFGTVYEGRGGGIERNVVGAHAAGFNTGTVGVALIGNFQTATPPKAMRDALVKLLAWRLDVAHVDPLSTVVYTSSGNAKFRAGKLVTLNAISGHRDTGPTECPGRYAYALLPALAKRVALTGLPKLYAPVAAGVLGGDVRFEARLSAPLRWTVTVADGLGHPVASGSGEGTVVDWTWNSRTAGSGPFTWTISAPGARVATGTLGAPRTSTPPTGLSLTDVATSPAVLAPNADGTMSLVGISFTLGVAAEVEARLVDQTGATVSTIFDAERRAGPTTVRWDASRVPDGRYRVVLTARSPAASAVTAWADFVVDHSVSGLAAAPSVFSPNHDLIDDTTTISFLLAQPAQVRLDIRSGATVVATPFQGRLGAGANTLTWDGSTSGVPPADGVYTAVLTVSDALGDVPFSVPVTVDDTPPLLQLVSTAPLLFVLSEPAAVTFVLGGTTSIVRDQPAGVFALPVQPAGTSWWLRAQDAAGNVSAPLSG
jgi:flagellar hook assembly protein FlgD